MPRHPLCVPRPVVILGAGALLGLGVLGGCLGAETPPADETVGEGEGEGEAEAPGGGEGAGEGEGEGGASQCPAGQAWTDGRCQDEGPTESPCVSEAVVTLGQALVQRSWWGRPDPEVVEISLHLEGTPCEPLKATSDEPFVRAALSEGALALWWAADGLTTGAHEAQVEIVEGGQVLAAVTVRVDMFASAPAGSPRRSLMIGIDGLRSDALAAANTPHMDRLASVGLWTPEASTHLTGDTVSGPGWASILTGAEVEAHGVDSNGDLHERRVPTYLRRTKDELGLATAVICHWAPIVASLVEPESMDLRATGDHDEVSAGMAQALATGEHDVHFVHFDDVDHAGHASGFSPDNAEYIEAVERVDDAVGQLMAAIVARPDVANEEWLLTLTTDHGGEGTGHGPRNRANRRIPLIIAGPSLPAGRLDGVVTHMDPAVTTLAFHGLHPQSAWGLDGRVLGLTVEGRCTDGIDDDGDGAVDCDDDDCQGDARCSQECPLEALPSPTPGQGLAVEGSNARANVLAGSCGGAEGPEMTWRFTAPWADRWFFETAGSEVDTALYLLQADAEGGCGGPELACNDDWFGDARYDVPISNQSALAVELAQDQTVIVVVDGFRRDAAGDVRLRAVGVRDTCPDLDLGEAVGPAVAEGVNADRPTRLHASCAGAARDTLLRWRAPAAGRYAFDTSGSDFDTVLAVHTGVCGDEIACDDDGGDGRASRIALEIAAGAELTLSVSGFRGRNGAWVLNITGDE